MANALFNELATNATGVCCTATGAWLAVALRGSHPMHVARATAYWNSASEGDQEAVAIGLGWLCNSGTVQSPPPPPAIMADFHALNRAAYKLLDFQG